MAKSRLIGDYPVIGIRPTIDGRRGVLKVRESLEDQTMNMAKSAAKLFVRTSDIQTESQLKLLSLIQQSDVLQSQQLAQTNLEKKV